MIFCVGVLRDIINEYFVDLFYFFRCCCCFYYLIVGYILIKLYEVIFIVFFLIKLECIEFKWWFCDLIVYFWLLLVVLSFLFLFLVVLFIFFIKFFFDLVLELILNLRLWEWYLYLFFYFIFFGFGFIKYDKVIFSFIGVLFIFSNIFLG